MQKLIEKIKYQFMDKPCFLVIGRFEEPQSDDFLENFMVEADKVGESLGVKISGYCDSYNIDLVVWSNKKRVNEKIRREVKKKMIVLSGIDDLLVDSFVDQSEVFEEI